MSAAGGLAHSAKYLLERGRLELARKVANVALAEDADCADAHSVMHVICDEVGEWVEGLRHARRAAELIPGSAQLRYNLALSALRLDDYRTGICSDGGAHRQARRAAPRFPAEPFRRAPPSAAPRRTGGRKADSGRHRAG